MNDEPSNEQRVITVITPAYNVSPFIAETIQSVLMQTYKDFNYFVVDDGSIDGTADIVRSFALRDKRVRLLRQENLGAGSARNLALSHCRSPFVAFIDGDDLWEASFLEEQLKYLCAQDKECVGVFCHSTIISEDHVQILGYFNATHGKYKLADMLKEVCPPGNGSCLLLRSEPLLRSGGFSLAPFGQDTETWLKILNLDPRYYFACNPTSLVKYRKREHSLTRNISLIRPKAWQQRLEKYLPDLSRTDQAEAWIALARGASKNLDYWPEYVQAWIAKARLLGAPWIRGLSWRSRIFMILGPRQFRDLVGARKKFFQTFKR